MRHASLAASCFDNPDSMITHQPRLRRHLPLLSLAPLLCACAFHPIEAVRRYTDDVQRKVAAIGPACTVGNARRPDGDWVRASLIFTSPANGNSQAFSYPLAAPVSTRAVRIALNANALHALEKVEVR